MIRVALFGASGRMGRAVYQHISKDRFQIVFGVDTRPAEDLPFPIYKSFDHCPLSADVILDFSTSSALDHILDYALATDTKCVLASTGYTDEQMKGIQYASNHVAIFHSANMSLGVNLLVRLVKDTAKFLGEGCDVEIVETHHSQKLDSPSGTALALARAVNQARGQCLTTVCGRESATKRRQKNEIGIHSVRGGTAVGKHEVMFFGAGETIKLCHEANSKEVFVRGAERAINYVMTKDSGLYDMDSIVTSFLGGSVKSQTKYNKKTSRGKKLAKQ